MFLRKKIVRKFLKWDPHPQENNELLKPNHTSYPMNNGMYGRYVFTFFHVHMWIYQSRMINKETYSCMPCFSVSKLQNLIIRETECDNTWPWPWKVTLKVWIRRIFAGAMQLPKCRQPYIHGALWKFEQRTAIIPPCSLQSSYTRWQRSNKICAGGISLDFNSNAFGTAILYCNVSQN